VTVVDENGRAREELQFSLREWLKTEDLFEYGMSPQFLSRFDAVVLLEALSEEALAKIFAEGGDSGLRQSQAYFQAFGCKLEMTAEAAQRVVHEAARKPRLGARALKGVFRRVGLIPRVRPAVRGGSGRRHPHRPGARAKGARDRPPERSRGDYGRLGSELQGIARACAGPTQLVPERVTSVTQPQLTRTHLTARLRRSSRATTALAYRFSTGRIGPGAASPS
jgi:hypothetical protein